MPEFHQCRVPNKSWQPPRCPQVCRYIRLLKDNLCYYEPLPRRSNESFVDKAARVWLQNHRDLVAVVDADKNLGDVVVDRRWVQDTCYKLLKQASVPVSSDVCRQAINDAKVSLDCILSDAVARRLVPARVQKYITNSFQSLSVGIFRLRVKIHKEPMSARPVMNLSRSWLGPLATFLTVALGPVMKAAPHVIHSSWQLQHALSELSAPDGYELSTLDIRNLYPSISHAHFMEKFAQRVRRHFCDRPSFANFIVRLTGLLLEFQFISFDDIIWQIRTGFATGLQAGVVFANVYLAELDSEFHAHFLDNSFSLALCWFRYIDDGLTVVRCGLSDQLRLFLNSWHPSIQWDVTATGHSVPYLDLRITVAGSSLSITTFRKAQNSYSYLPRSSCHPRSVFNALISGEAGRLSRHNFRNSHAWTRELEFFIDRLGKRGYNKDEARHIINATLHRLQRKTLPKTQTKRRLCFFKQVFSSSLNSPTIKTALKRDWHVIQRIFPVRCDILLSFRMQPSDFRRNYATTWLKSVKTQSR